MTDKDEHERPAPPKISAPAVDEDLYMALDRFTREVNAVVDWIDAAVDWMQEQVRR